MAWATIELTVTVGQSSMIQAAVLPEGIKVLVWWCITHLRYICVSYADGRLNPDTTLWLVTRVPTIRC